MVLMNANDTTITDPFAPQPPISDAWRIRCLLVRIEHLKANVNRLERSHILLLRHNTAISDYSNAPTVQSEQDATTGAFKNNSPFEEPSPPQYRGNGH